jgi:cytoskeletal protein CcmA (bactofilin family)
MRRKARTYENIASVIAEGVDIKGDINAQNSMRIDGSVEGKLNIKGDLVVGERGRIKGEVKVANIILAGKVEGNVAATGRLEITATGNMNGDISCSIMTIEEGGILEGSSRMSRQKEKPEAERLIPGRKLTS